MCCPECGKESRQIWSDGYPATMETPDEPAGYECGWCGAVYGSKWEREAAKADHNNDARWAMGEE